MACLARLLVARRLLAEAPLEPGDPATGVQDLLLAGVEGVAARADVRVDLAVLRCASSGEGAPAGAGHRRHHVVGVNTGLLLCLLGSGGRRVAAPRGDRETDVNRYRAIVGIPVCQTLEQPSGPGNSRRQIG